MLRRFRKVFLVTMSIVCFSLIKSSIAHIVCKDWIVDRKIEKEWSSLAFLRGKNKERVVLKQLKGHPVRFISNLVADTVGALIAQSARVYSNDVQIMASQSNCTHKKLAHQPATLHSFIEGHTLERYPGRIRKMIVQLNFIGNQKILGLTRDIIDALTAHEDLPAIAAIDTFMGNIDRLPKNIMRHKESRRLYAIDFTLAFSTNLAGHSLRNLKALVRRRAHFSTSERKALEIYKNTLKHLLKVYSPHTLQTLIQQAFHQTGFLRHKRYSNTLKKLVIHRINQYKKIALESYASTKELVHLLDAIT